MISTFFTKLIMASRRESTEGAKAQFKVNLRYVRVMRLRQVLSHPFLVEELFTQVFKLKDTQFLRTFLGKMGKVSVYDQIGSWSERYNRIPQYKLEKDDAVPGSPIPANIHDVPKLEPFGHSQFGGIFDMNRLLELVHNDQLVRSMICELCGVTPPKDPVKLLPVCHSLHLFLCLFPLIG